MNVYDDLLKLINEQGSFLILQERLLLLKEQLDLHSPASEADIANLVAKVDLLGRKVALLEVQNQKLTEENQALQLEIVNLCEQLRNRDD